MPLVLACRCGRHLGAFLRCADPCSESVAPPGAPWAGLRDHASLSTELDAREGTAFEQRYAADMARRLHLRSVLGAPTSSVLIAARRGVSLAHRACQVRVPQSERLTRKPNQATPTCLANDLLH